MAELESKSLAELHRLAGEAGIEKFRLLRREQLIEKLGGGTDGSASDRSDSGSGADGTKESDGSRSRRSRRSRSRRRSGGGEERDRRRDDQESGDDAGEEKPAKAGIEEEVEPELGEVTGVLEVLHRGSGVIRGEGAPEAGVHVSPAQIRRCELRSGDEVSGPVRPARRGERRPSLVRVEQVNGKPPADDRSPRFDSLTPIPPHRPIPLSAGSDDVPARALDLLAPLAFGQRMLIEAAPRSGRTTLLQAVARAITAGDSDASVVVLLVDERPEEVTRWKREAPDAEIIAAPADLGAHEQVKVAERARARVKRQAEAGDDVVLMIDSLTRLGSAFGDASAVKPFFGIGRELEEDEAGSITVIATALNGVADDRAVLDAVAGSQNATVRLDAALVSSGVSPSLDIQATTVVDCASLIGAEGSSAIDRLRAELDRLGPPAAADRLVELITGSGDNAELRGRL